MRQCYWYSLTRTHYLFNCCCVEHSEAEMARYHDSRSKMNADIEVLQNCMHDYIEQLKLEYAKSEQLELIVSLQSSSVIRQPDVSRMP